MDFLDKLNIKSKLLLLLFFPLMGFIFLGLYDVNKSYTKYESMKDMKKLIILSTKMSALVHETQKERGMTAGLLSSKGKKFADKINLQRELSDKKFKDLKEFSNSVNYKNYSEILKKDVDLVISKYNGLSTIRPQVDNFEIDTPKAISYYTSLNSSILDTVVFSARISTNVKLTNELTAYSSFLLSKERAGIERAVGASTLSRDSFAPKMKEKLNNLISAQDSFMKSFLYYANDDWIEFYKKTLTGKPIEEVERIRKIMLESEEIGGFNVKPEYWFETITKKINFLKNVENFIRDNLNIKDEDLQIAVKVASGISNLLHETQKERGATAGFIGSSGKNFVEKLPNQRKLTDIKIKELKAIIKDSDVDYFSIEFQNNLKDSLVKLEKILSMREEVSKLNISAKDAISYYTSMNSSFLHTIASVVKMATNGSETKDLNSFYNFLMAKERAGIERAVLSNSFARNKFLPGMKQKFIVLVTEQESFLKSFFATAKPKYIRYYKSVVKGEAIDEVNRMRKLALSTTGIGGFGVDATYWFSEITKKINMLKKVDDFLAESLIHDVLELQSQSLKSMIIILVVIVLGLILILFLARLITRRINNALLTFKTGLGYFFQYAIREKDYLKPMDVKGSDEFAQMTLEMNKQIERTEFIIEQDKKVVLEIDDVMTKVKNGFFGYTIEQKGATDEVESLRNSMNEMLSDTKKKLDNVNNILDQYVKSNYVLNLTASQKQGMYGDMGLLMGATTLLGSSSAQLLATISNASDELDSTTKILASSSQTLSVSSNEQASSLEETAASVEQITSNIRSNSQNVIAMESLSDELNTTAKIGADLADKTALSMDEINQKVSAINEAITVIDQIAFQTNILSLNAAVEAATAGEAGKGFAVVAQEVRNLANRSAEAAREIKNLVEDATNRASSGKEIADEMILGYNTLNSKVIETKEMIDSVSTASKEQEVGMVQINEAINNLEKATQQNVSTANSIDELSSEVSKLSDRLQSVTSQATFDEKTRNRVCDIELISEVTKYKNDHIKFKDNNFNKLGDKKSLEVANCKSCNLGKWILECENNNRAFTNSSTWSEMKVIHEKLHNQVQLLVDKNSKNELNENITSIASSIEDSTFEIFDKLDELLEENCRN